MAESINTPGLGEIAGRHGRIYGAAIQSDQLDDPHFYEAVRRECRIIVPETELKWDALRPSPDIYDFSGYQKLGEFVCANDIALRGHVLVWHYANPDWLEPALVDKKAAQKILDEHIHCVVRTTCPLIRSWDVVNEAIDPRSPRADGLRETLWLKALGPSYVADAYHIAHRAHPDAHLVYNEFGLEYDDGYGRRKRELLLANLERWMRRDQAPIHAIGLQSHLQVGRALGGRPFVDFLKRVRDMGLEVFVSEMDVSLSHLTGKGGDKIAAAQTFVRSYLDLIQAEGSIGTLLTWGLTDRYSWMREQDPGLAGALPLDRSLKRSPLWETLRASWAERGRPGIQAAQRG